MALAGSISSEYLRSVGSAKVIPFLKLTLHGQDTIAVSLLFYESSVDIALSHSGR